MTTDQMERREEGRRNVVRNTTEKDTSISNLSTILLKKLIHIYTIVNHCTALLERIKGSYVTIRHIFLTPVSAEACWQNCYIEE